MQTDEIINSAKQDWTIENQKVLKRCILQANESMFGVLEDYPCQERISIIRGFIKWDLLDYHLEGAASKEMFDGITAGWEKYRGAKILQLTGQNSYVIAKHVLESDDDPIDSEDSFRKANREQNQLLMFGEQHPHDGKARIVLVHGGFGENAFAFLKMYFETGAPLKLTDNIMSLPELDGVAAEEFVLDPITKLKPITPAQEPEISPEEPIIKVTNVHAKP